MKVSIADYLSSGDSKGTPIGHGAKVLNEACGLLREYNPTAFAYEETLKKITSVKFTQLPYYVIADKNEKGIKEKIKDYWVKFFNIRYILHSNDSDIVWFTNVDRFLFFYLSLFMPKQKIAVTLYKDLKKDFTKRYGNNRFLKGFYNKGFDRVSLFIVTNRNLNYGKRQLFVPDYIYTDFYDRFRNKDKDNMTVCLGTNRRGKKETEELVRSFKGTQKRLKVVGKFLDDDMFDACKQYEDEYITVDNKTIDDEEYYTLMGKAKFVALPYSMKGYHYSTSGVLQEAAFLGAIPIAPKGLLEFTTINGLGYEHIEDVPELIDECYDSVSQDLTDYQENTVRNKILDAFTRILNKER